MSASHRIVRMPSCTCSDKRRITSHLRFGQRHSNSMLVCRPT